VEKNLAFRSWYYFRTGWSTYFAFIFAAINTLTVTYFLAIENYPILESIFPTFAHYIVIVALVGAPLLTFVGFVHFKKSKSHVSEQDVLIETSPHMRRILLNTEVLLPSYLKLLELITKLSQNEKLSQEDMNQISKLKNDLDDHIKQRQVK
tara:strand:- start:11159 stop:11611 length:453 start_codon:yes stop_codon:yes gene_type:complete